MSRTILGLFLAAILVTDASGAQPGWDITVLGPAVSPSQPSVTVRISARFDDPPDYAFAHGELDVVSAEGDWSAPRLLPGRTSGYGEPGIPAGPAVREIVAGQFNIPNVFYANAANPLDVWEATWTTSDFRPREVNLSTLTTRFEVFFLRNNPDRQTRLGQLTEGYAFISVVPAPPALFLAGLGLILRRRR